MQGPGTNKKLGSSCGSIGKAVASDSSGQQFESSNWQNLYWPFVYCQLYWKDENKEKIGQSYEHFTSVNYDSRVVIRAIF